jgi:adenylate kinase family enzyme
VGKSTYAKELAREKNLEYYQLDHIRYPEGKKLPDKDFRDKVKNISLENSWVIEGTLKSTEDIIFPRATKIIVLKASRFVCTFRALKRTVRRVLGIEESSVFNDLEKLFSKDFIVFWVWRNYPRYLADLDQALKNTKHNAQVVEEKI